MSTAAPVFDPVLSTRLARRYRQRIAAAPAQVFPLLCPQREKEWLPGWQCTMIHSASGIAERGAVFATPDAHAGQAGPHDVVWLVVEHVAPARVRFVRWHPEQMVVDIEIVVTPAGDGATFVDVAYTYTAVSAAGARRIAAMDEAAWLAQMHTWEGEMNAWLAAQRRGG
jgi:hypothetical protein